MRKLATIRKIQDLSPIEGADLIELATLDGWRTVVKKGAFQVGDLVIYFEIDSWIPETLAPFLCKGKEYQGIRGARLQTVRLCKQLSQGLALPFTINPKDASCPLLPQGMQEGDDVTELLGVVLWEPPPPKQQGFTGSKPLGNFPSFLRKTDQERVQNLSRDLTKWQGDLWEVTEKLDGTSFTAFRHEGREGVCSRNLELKPDDSPYWRVANETKIFAAIQEGYAVQGEIVGPGVCGNKYGLTEHRLYVFDVFSIAEQRYLSPSERSVWVVENKMSEQPWFHVPTVLCVTATPANVDAALTMANMTSTIAPVLAEGLVFKSLTSQRSFKAISNAWLEKFKG